MSYLPRMSKTYKEPQALESEEIEEGPSLSNLQPASSSVSDKTFNPQIALKHYKYYPHPLPVLPGPSLTDEAIENEIFQEQSKFKRSASKIGELSIRESNKTLQNSTIEFSEVSFREIKASDSSVKPTQSKVQNFSKSNKSLTSRNKSSKAIVGKHKDVFKHNVHVCLVEDDITETYLAAQTAKQEQSSNDDEENDQNDGDDDDDADDDTTDDDNDNDNYDDDDADDDDNGDMSDDDFSEPLAVKDCENLKSEKDALTIESPTSSKDSERVLKNISERTLTDNKKFSSTKTTETVHRSVQCAIFASSDRTFVIPSTINILLKSLAFLLHEINKDDELSCMSPEGKRLMTQIQLILGDFCNQDVVKDFHFQVNYSDSKRVEKLLEDLRKFVKTVYGEKNELIDKPEALKKIFVELKLKELALEVLRDKIHEKNNLKLTEVEIKESYLKNPELTLQNKRLESDQLLAQAEFSRIELVKYQKALAEADWEIKVKHDQLSSIKKSSGSKSKIPEGLSRKPSLQKFGAESTKKGIKGKEMEEGKNKKKII